MSVDVVVVEAADVRRVAPLAEVDTPTPTGHRPLAGEVRCDGGVVEVLVRGPAVTRAPAILLGCVPDVG